MPTDNRLEEFVKTGVIEGLKPGDDITPRQKKKWDASVAAHPNGKPELYQYQGKRLCINIGATEDEKISYLVLHLYQQEGTHSLTLGDETLNWKELTLAQLIEFLDANKLAWKFSHAWQRLVVLSIEESPIELVFSYFPNEVGLSLIQALNNKHE